jgi:hypothetical protein
LTERVANGLERQRAADEFRHRAFPDWLVLWGSYSHQYTAFPLFICPRPAYVTARNLDDLQRLMRQVSSSVKSAAGLPARPFTGTEEETW